MTSTATDGQRRTSPHRRPAGRDAGRPDTTRGSVHEHGEQPRKRTDAESTSRGRTRGPQSKCRNEEEAAARSQRVDGAAEKRKL
ncbi:hypothetical protein Tco_0386852 [Tanacetum coccineum]